MPPVGFFLLISEFSSLIHFCSVLVLFRPLMSFTVHNRLFTTQHKHPNPRWDFFLFIPGFSPLIHLYCWSPFRPACHLMFHAIVHTSNTTQTSMPPVVFEPTIPVSERPQTHASDRTANGIGATLILSTIMWYLYKLMLGFKVLAIKSLYLVYETHLI
jgi:hypothetical protein